MYVSNLPLCWPVIRLAIGTKGDSSDPSSYPNPSFPNSTSRIKTQNRHPLASTASVWAKLDDEDGQRTNPSPEQGSQIELVEQNALDLVQQPHQTRTGVSSTPGHGHGTGDHIKVVTTVDVRTK